jgi:tRNA-specific 2-thiouridylase
MARIVLAMSGGVDSSVAAWLLREQGHDVVGVFMRHGLHDATPALGTACVACQERVEKPDSAAAGAVADGQAVEPSKPRRQGCCSAEDAADARRVAEVLGIPFYALNFEEHFNRIVDYFCDEYLAGRTPNPCIVCNTWLKFGKLFEYADGIGAEYVATGHYARIAPPAGGGSPMLCRGLDRGKDQSYVLFGIERKLLSRLALPVGDYRKEEIRRIAADLGLRVADKRDSQEICFVPDDDHAGFVRKRRGDSDTSGEIVTTTGEVVGRHNGLEGFTIGQRKGLRVAFGERRYVVRLEPDTHRVVVGRHDALARAELTAKEANWLIDAPQRPFACTVRIRYRSQASPATVEPLGESRFRVRFDEPCHGVAPGQAAVCYQDDRVLGGGWIESY